MSLKARKRELAKFDGNRRGAEGMLNSMLNKNEGNDGEDEGKGFATMVSPQGRWR